MHCMVKLLILASLVCYFDQVYSSLETWIEIEEDDVETITGVVTDGKKNTCTYFENRLRGKSGPRLLEMRCKKPNGSKAYDCDYKGNPHNCKWYNKKHQPQFYADMAKELAKVRKGACHLAEVESNVCGGIIFRKQ